MFDVTERRNSRARERRRALFGAACVAVVSIGGALGCDDFWEQFRQGVTPPEGRMHSAAAKPMASIAAAEPPAPPKAAAPRPEAVPAAVPLDPDTRRAMKLPPRQLPTERLAFARGRLGQLTADTLVVRDFAGAPEPIRISMTGPRVVTGLADGSLFAAGRDASVRLLPNERKGRLYPHVILFPDSVLFADRASPDRLWVGGATGTRFFGYDLDPAPKPLLLPSATVELEGYDHHALGSLRDGSFFYTVPDGFRQFYGRGRKIAAAADTASVFRILPGSRPDTAWVLRRDGRAELVLLLLPKLRRSTTVALETTPFDADAAGRALAVLELSQPDHAPWGFVLEVFDVDGKRRFRTELAADESDGADWVARLTRDRGVVLSAGPPLVAVGGPEHVDVFDWEKGGRVYSGP